MTTSDQLFEQFRRINEQRNELDHERQKAQIRAQSHALIWRGTPEELSATIVRWYETGWIEAESREEALNKAAIHFVKSDGTSAILPMYSGSENRLQDSGPLPGATIYGVDINDWVGCAAEKGFIEAHWHLELMVACPIHRCLATSECPKCKERLHWLRPGLLECACGGNLQDSDMPKVSSSEAALLDIMRRKLLGYPAADENPLAISQEQLMAMDLRSMLAVVRAIAKYRLVADGYTADPDDQQIVRAAAHVVMDWPKNFFVLLKDIGQKASAGEYGGVGKQYGDIYRALFRNRAIAPSACADFLRVAFLDFAMDHCGRAFVDDNSSEETIDTDNRRFLSQAEFAERARLHQKTAIRLLKTLKLSSKPVAKGSTRASLAHKKRTDIRRRRRDPGMILDMVRYGSKLGRLDLVDLQIADGSGAAFRREYISLTAIAEAEQISTVELMRLCAERNVRVLLLPVSRQGLQPIIVYLTRENS